MNLSKQRKVGVILSYIIIVLNMVIGIAYTPILTRMLGQSEYGLYSLVSSIISYLTILDFGFGNAIIIYTTRYRVKGEKEKEKKLHGMFLIIYSLIGFIAAILGMILYFNVDKLFGQTMSIEEIKTAKTLMGILTLNLALTFPLSIFSSIITAYEKFVFAKILNIIRIILNPIITIILLKMGYKSISLVIVITILNISTLLINMIYCRSKLQIKLKFGKIDMSLLKEITAYSFFIFLNTVIDKITWSTDQFVLGAVSGTIQVALYSTANQLNTMYLNFSTAISGVLLPKVTKMEEQNATDKEFSNIFIKIGRLQYIMIALIITGFILYGKEFINLMWVGPEYSQSYFIACILMIPVTLPLIQNIGINILQAKNKHQYRSVILTITAIMNVIISIPLSKIYGGIGAAIGTFITLLIGPGLLMNIFYYKKINIDIPRFWRNILKMTLIILICFIIGMSIKIFYPIQSNIALVVQIVLYTIIYIIIMWKCAMNQYEKELFTKLARKISKGDQK